MKCTPNPGQPGGGVFFMKYTKEFKLDCVLKYIEGTHIDTPVGIKRCSFMNLLRRWVSWYKELGVEGLEHQQFNKEWTKEKRFKLVSKVLAGSSISSISIKAHIDSGQLYQWVRNYRNRGMEGLQCKKGRKPKVPHMPKTKKEKIAHDIKEELQILRARNEYLEAENAYLKKLDALVTKREAAHPKAKKQK